MRVQILFDRVNHFHLFVRIKMEKEISFLSGSYTLSGSEIAERVEIDAAPSVVINPDGGLVAKRYNPVSQFSHLFNAYAQA